MYRYSLFYKSKPHIVKLLHVSMCVCVTGKTTDDLIMCLSLECNVFVCHATAASINRLFHKACYITCVNKPTFKLIHSFG